MNSSKQLKFGAIMSYFTIAFNMIAGLIYTPWMIEEKSVELSISNEWNKEKLLPDDYDNVTFPLTMLGWDLGEQINPIMYSAKEWEASRITPFYQNVVQDAIVLT